MNPQRKRSVTPMSSADRRRRTKFGNSAEFVRHAMDVDIKMPMSELWKLTVPRRAILSFFICRDCREHLSYNNDRTRTKDDRCHISFSLCKLCTHKNINYADKWYDIST